MCPIFVGCMCVIFVVNMCRHGNPKVICNIPSMYISLMPVQPVNASEVPFLEDFVWPQMC